MKHEPEEITLAEYKRLSAKLPKKRAKKKPKANIPRATDVPRDGLMGLLVRGWSTRTRNGGAEHQLYRGAQETAWHTDQSAACQEAKLLERSSRRAEAGG